MVTTTLSPALGVEGDSEIVAAETETERKREKRAIFMT
jgi:hypothetical protein